MWSHQLVVTILLAIIAWAVGSIIWAVRLEGRVNLVERLLEDAGAEHRAATSRIMRSLDRLERQMTSIRVTCVAFQHQHHAPQTVDGLHDPVDPAASAEQG